MLKNFLRVAPGLSIITVFMALYWSPIYELMPPDFQLFTTKLFLSVLGVVVAHWVGKGLFPIVIDWNTTDQPFIKAARIALYVAIPISCALGG